MIPNTLPILVKQYLENKVTAGVLQVLEWPPQSPYMSLIEATWDYLETKNKRNPTHLAELWNVLQDILHNIPVKVLQSFAGSMGKRVMALKVANGGHTKY